MSGADQVTVELSTPGRLTPTAAASYERLLAATGTTGTTQANHAWRSYQDQLDLWHAYMTTSWAASDKNPAHTRYWNGRVWYRRPNKPSVAFPGQSNHGDGDTVDWQGLGGYGSGSWNRFAAAALTHGWNNVEGRSVNEPWHWGYVRLNDQYRNVPNPEPINPFLQETDMKVVSYNGVTYIVNGLSIERLDDATEISVATTLYGPAIGLDDIGWGALRRIISGLIVDSSNNLKAQGL